MCVCFSAKSRNWSPDAQNCTKVCSHGPLELAAAEDHCKHHKNNWSYNISNPISKPKWFGKKYWLLGASYGWIASGSSEVSQTLLICLTSYLKLLQGPKESFFFFFFLHNLKRQPGQSGSDHYWKTGGVDSCGRSGASKGMLHFFRSRIQMVCVSLNMVCSTFQTAFKDQGDRVWENNSRKQSSMLEMQIKGSRQ